MFRSCLIIIIYQKVISLLYPANNIKEEVGAVQITNTEAYNPAFLTLKIPDRYPQKMYRTFQLYSKTLGR